MVVRRRLTAVEKRSVAAAHGWKCGMCGAMLPANYEIDHIVPLCEGGEDRDPGNLWPLCAFPCHARKTEEEAHARARAKRPRVLWCDLCGACVSPYFLHRCAPQA